MVWYGMVWYGMVDVCDGYLAAEARAAVYPMPWSMRNYVYIPG